MAPTLNQEIGLRLGTDPQNTDPQNTDFQAETDRGVLLPSARPGALEPPFSRSLPRAAAGQQRTAAMFRVRRLVRLDWFELSTVGLGLACTALSVYRLFWAIH